MYDSDQPALQGEYLSSDDRERLSRALYRAGQQGVTADVAARISRMPLFNWLQERQIRSAIRVINAEHEFHKALAAHQNSLDELRELPHDLAAKNRLKRINAQIAEEEAELRLAQLRKARAALNGTGDDDLDRKYDEQLKVAQRRAEHDLRMKVFNAQKNLQMINELRKERDRMIQEVTGGRETGLTPEQEHQVENIRDFFQRLMDEI
jgi:hypothetical protein